MLHKLSFQCMIVFFCALSINPWCYAQSSSEVEVAILPVVDFPPQAIKLVREAKNEILLAVESPDFSINGHSFMRRLADEIILQYRRGIRVEVLIHEGNKQKQDENSSHSLRHYLYSMGVPVYETRDGKKINYNILIFDNFTVLCSSMAWTDENFNLDQGLSFWCESENFVTKMKKIFLKDKHV